MNNWNTLVLLPIEAGASIPRFTVYLPVAPQII